MGADHGLGALPAIRNRYGCADGCDLVAVDIKLAVILIIAENGCVMVPAGAGIGLIYGAIHPGGAVIEEGPRYSSVIEPDREVVADADQLRAAGVGGGKVGECGHGDVLRGTEQAIDFDAIGAIELDAVVQLTRGPRRRADNRAVARNARGVCGRAAEGFIEFPVTDEPRQVGDFRWAKFSGVNTHVAQGAVPVLSGPGADAEG